MKLLMSQDLYSCMNFFHPKFFLKLCSLDSIFMTCKLTNQRKLRGGGNSTIAEEVSRFQHLFHNPQLVDARKGI